jgi:hypothetical protein
MYTFANTLLTKLNACAHVAVEQRSVDEYVVTVDLGTGWSGEYAGGYWADTVRITDDNLQLQFSVWGGDMRWSDDEEYCISEGVVHLHYADFGSGNLAYTSALEDAVNSAVYERTNGLLDTDGSEQGMQGYDAADECYLSLDVCETVEDSVLA